LATAIVTAKDHQRNEIDKALLEKYVHVLEAYKFSATWWELKNQNGESIFGGDIPVGFDGAVSPAVAPGIAEFGLKTSDRTFSMSGRRWSSLPGDPIQTMWTKAEAVSSQATEIYYGRSTPGPNGK
jgi:hypothetical protein